MAKKIKEIKVAKEVKQTLPSDIQAVFYLSCSALGLLSLFSFTFLHPESNYLGYIGYIAALGCMYLFGLSSYLIPIYLFILGYQILMKKTQTLGRFELICFLGLLFSCSMLLTVFAACYPEAARFFKDSAITESVTFYTPFAETITRFNLGGVPVYFLFSDLPFLPLQKVLSPVGCSLIFSSIALICFIFLSQLPLLKILQWIKDGAIQSLLFFKKTPNVAAKQNVPFTKPILKQPPVLKEEKRAFAGMQTKTPKIVIPEEKPQVQQPKEKKLSEIFFLKEKKVDPIKKESTPKTKPQAQEKLSLDILPKQIASLGSYQVPSPEILSSSQAKHDLPTLKKDLMIQASVLEDTLKSFGIEAKVGEINSGPTITSFEVHPSIGVKVQKIKSLENDIALNMQAKSIRIVAPIPGKAAVGVEVPAIHPQEVNFKEMLTYYIQKGKKFQIPVLLGKAINGDWVFSDLSKMPHLLIAGATGSGKSVCVNTIVMSILMNCNPEDVKFLMIDPKKVELTQYSKLPHMIAPVITEPHGAYAALQWLVKEMQVRYEILKQLGLRNISAFNTRTPNMELESSLSISIPPHMPYIVAMVDEFADLMMVSSADIETPIARIAQMARAVGIHLILATQRPSREVITGIIKANIPTRISFKVASRINSQIILDDVGAESLLGNGDLLFLPPGTSQLVRAQGAYISDADINKVIQSIENTSQTNYLIPSFDAFKALENTDLAEPKGKDSLYQEAHNIVVSSKNASTTFLQRKLKIGYARAAGLMDELEANGVIGPQDGAKPRKILATQTSFLPPDEGADHEDF